MTPFLIVGLLAVGVLWALTRRRWHLGARVAVAGVFIALLAGLLITNVVTLGADQPAQWYERTPAREVLFLVFMLLGIAARSLSKAIEERRAQITRLRESGGPLAKPKLEMDVWEFAYPMLFAVITYGALLGQIGASAVTFQTMVLSFQNGFFWQTLLRTREDARELGDPQRVPPAAPRQ